MQKTTAGVREFWINILTEGKQISACAHTLFGGSQRCTGNPIRVSTASHRVSGFLCSVESRAQKSGWLLRARRVKMQVRHIGGKYMSQILLNWMVTEGIVLYL